MINKAKEEIREILQTLYVYKTVSTYKARLITIARVLFRTEDLNAFIDTMTEIVTFNLNDAWFSATKQCGFTRDEASNEENEARESLINISLSSITGFGQDILTGKENGKKVSDFQWRITIWANRWDEAFNQARTIACGDKKFKWIIDPAIANCKTCLRLNGKVKRSSIWDAHGVYPQATNGSLICNGFNCGCSLIPTNEPLSRGPLPNVP